MIQSNINSSGLLTGTGFSGIREDMKSIDEHILRTTKEIVVKFIEMGRLSPSSVHESFRDVYATVSDTIKGGGSVTPMEKDQKQS